MCNTNPNNFKSETEYLMAVHGIQPVIANPMQTFQCGKCGTQNIIPAQQMIVAQHDYRENCRVAGIPFCAQPDAYKEYFHERVRATKATAKSSCEVKYIKDELCSLEHRVNNLSANSSADATATTILLALVMIPVAAAGLLIIGAVVAALLK